MKSRVFKAVDLFSGCGGLSLGFEKAGFSISKAVEWDTEIAHSYSMNHSNTIVFNDDIGSIDDEQHFSRYEADVIIGGPPCQGFSMAGARIRNGFVDDPRNYLFRHYLNVVKIVSPSFFVFENVKGILNMQKGGIFQEIISAFSNPENFHGDIYELHYHIFNSAEFGIPQKRERVVIFGSKIKGIDWEDQIQNYRNKIYSQYPGFFDPVTVWDAISNLGPVSESGKISNPEPKSKYQSFLSSDSPFLFNHQKTNHSELAISRMGKVKNGENWMVLDESILSVHSGAYGRLFPNCPSPTITTRFDTPSGGKFIHPFENRTLTPREAARIQSFPDDFVFYGSKTSICKQIGNAVPPKLSFFLANIIGGLLNENIFGKAE